jgi:hypothetical protein
MHALIHGTRYFGESRSAAIIARADPRREIIAEFGDPRRVEAFIPQARLKLWGECEFAIEPVDDAIDQWSAAVDSEGRLVCRRGDRSVLIRQIPASGGLFEDGGMAFDVEYAKRPASNVIRYSIQTKGLTFHPQPDGSIAVYHATKAHNFTWGKDYRTGKAFHIPRTRATDAVGKVVMCDTHVDVRGGLLTLTVPQLFVDTATYPIIVDPDFGYTTIGGTGAFGVNACMAFRQSGQQYTAGASEQIEGFSFYGSRDSGFPSGNCNMAVYDWSGTVPVNRLAAGETITPPADNADDWTAVSGLSQALADTTTYGPAIGLNFVVYYYDVVSDVVSNDAQTPATLPATWSEDSLGNRKISMYATYAAAGGGGNPWYSYEQQGAAA